MSFFFTFILPFQLFLRNLKLSSSRRATFFSLFLHHRHLLRIIRDEHCTISSQLWSWLSHNRLRTSFHLAFNLAFTVCVHVNVFTVASVIQKWRTRRWNEERRRKYEWTTPEVMLILLNTGVYIVAILNIHSFSRRNMSRKYFHIDWNIDLT